MAGMARGPMAPAAIGLGAFRRPHRAVDSPGLGLAALLGPPGRGDAGAAALRSADRSVPSRVARRRGGPEAVERLPESSMVAPPPVDERQRHRRPTHLAVGDPARPERHRVLVYLPSVPPYADRPGPPPDPARAG